MHLQRQDPAGLAPVDLTLDSSLRSGDVVATTDGLVAYTGVKLGAKQTAEFTPVASYPGLTANVRARLGEMKVAPVSAEMVAESPLPEERDESRCRRRGAEEYCAKGSEAGGGAVADPHGEEPRLRASRTMWPPTGLSSFETPRNCARSSG